MTIKMCQLMVSAHTLEYLFKKLNSSINEGTDNNPVVERWKDMRMMGTERNTKSTSKVMNGEK